MLQNKNIVITGASGGIGLAIVEECARHGANVWACARTKDEAFEKHLEGISLQNSVKCRSVYFDLTNQASMKRAIEEIRCDARIIDGLVNNAGMVAEPRAFVMQDAAMIRTVMEINFVAPAIFTQYIVRIMQRAKNGSIVNVSSVAALDGFPGQFEYAASKGAVIGGTKELAAELGEVGIRVNAVAPGVIDTKMGGQVEEHLREAMAERSALRRIGQPYEVARVIAFLLSDSASLITGQIIRVDGGLSVPGTRTKRG